MLPAMSEGVTLGKPHAHHKCHVDPYFADLDVRIDCTLTQGYKTDDDGNVIRDDNGNRIPKPVGTIHRGEGQPDPVMLVNVGLRGPLLHHLCGSLCVRVHLECIGAGPEIDLPSEKYSRTQDVTELRIEGDDGLKCCQTFEPDDWCYYEFRVTIPLEAFKEYGRDCGEFCCFATTVTSRDRCDRPGHIGCWCNGPCVMIHTPPQN